MSSNIVAYDLSVKGPRSCSLFDSRVYELIRWTLEWNFVFLAQGRFFFFTHTDTQNKNQEKLLVAAVGGFPTCEANRKKLKHLKTRSLGLSPTQR